MRWLVRRVHRKGKSQVSFEDDIHFGDVLTIGRAANQAVFLTDMRAALEHARITLTDRGKYRIESVLDAGVRVNGAIVHNTTSGPGAQVEIGSTRITLIDAPEDYDGAVEISQIDKSEIAAEAAAKRLPTTLRETRLSKRGPAWVLFAAILVLLGLIATYKGHSCDPDAAGVARATTSTVVTASVCILLADYVITALWNV